MAKQTIGIGSIANDGTGDPLRTAMDKVNDNFDELYAVTESPQTDSYILVLTDNLKLVTVTTAGASTLTVPPNVDVAFPVGAMILICQGGAGQVTVTEGAGVTINSAGGALLLVEQYSTATLIQTAADTWLLSGAITA